MSLIVGPLCAGITGCRSELGHCVQQVVSIVGPCVQESWVVGQI